MRSMSCSTNPCPLIFGQLTASPRTQIAGAVQHDIYCIFGVLLIVILCWDWWDAGSGIRGSCRVHDCVFHPDPAWDCACAWYHAHSHHCGPLQPGLCHGRLGPGRSVLQPPGQYPALPLTHVTTGCARNSCCLCYRKQECLSSRLTYWHVLNPPRTSPRSMRVLFWA